MSAFNSELDRLLLSQTFSESEIIEFLLTNCYADLRRLASNILRDANEAEDAAQETFWRAYQNIGEPDLRAMVLGLAWLYVTYGALPQAQGSKQEW